MMIQTGLVLAPCAHGNRGGQPQQCTSCGGSGWVSVIPDSNGEPQPCAHANTDGQARNCGACRGSGWAGVVGAQHRG